MARRRPGGGGGGAPGAAAVGGAAWRQQQQAAELRAQLLLLPQSDGDVREWLLHGVGRVLDMVDSHVSMLQHTPTRSHEQDGAVTAAMTAVAALAATGSGTAVEQEELVGMQEGAGDETEGLMVGHLVEDEEAPLELEEVVEAAADAAVGALNELLAAAVGALAGSDGGRAGAADVPPVGAVAGAATDTLMRPGTAPDTPWDWGLYCSALLHHHLMLSTELLPGAMGELRRGQQQLLGSSIAHTSKVDNSSATGNSSSTCGKDAGSGTMQPGPELARDELAPAARRRPLPVGVYGRVVAAMGWHGMALDLLQWLPAGGRGQGERQAGQLKQQQSIGSVRTEAAGLCLADVVQECPGAAPGYARVLLSGAVPASAASATARASCGRAAGAGAAAAQGFCEHLAASPHLLRAVAAAVKGATAAVAASSSGRGTAGQGGQGSVAVCMHPTARASSHVAVPMAAEGWLWCCLLLARALAGALRGTRGTGRGAGLVGADGHLVGSAAGACEEGDCAEQCAGALEEGLCAWQDAFCGAGASGGSRATGGAGGGGSAGAGEQAAAVGEQLLRVLQGQLLPLLEEEARLHMAAQLGRHHQREEQEGQEQQQEQLRPVLACGTAVRLRARVSLLLMAACRGTGGSVAAEGQQQQQQQPHGAGAAGAGGGGGTGTQGGASASAVWDAVATLSLPSNTQGLGRTHGAGQDPAAAGAGAAPPWLRRAAGHVSAHAPTRQAQASVPAVAAAAAAAGGEQRQPAGVLPMQQLTSLLQRKLRLPGATLPHRAARPCSSRPPAIPQQLAHAARLDAQGHVALSCVLSAQGGAGQGVEEGLAAAACALLTPGLPSWLAAQRDPRVRTAAGPSPYSPFRTALACLEMLQNAVGGAAVLGADELGEAGERMQQQGGVEGQLQEGGVEGRRREVTRTLLRMAAECLVCTAGVEQQAALQAVVLGGEAFAGWVVHVEAACHALPPLLPFAFDRVRGPPHTPFQSFYLNSATPPTSKASWAD